MNEDDERLEEVIEERRRFEAAGAVIGVVIVVTVVSFLVVVFNRGGDDPPAVVPTASLGVPQEPRLSGTVDLRSAPSDQVAIVTRLLQTEPIRVLGRSADGQWVALGPSARPTVIGWVLVTQVEGVDVAALPVLADPRAGGAAGVPTFTPDLPDLVVEAAFARQNRLHLTVHNQGAADAPGTILVSVNEGEPVPLRVARPGEPLRAGERVEGEVPGHTVQIRSTIRIHLIVDPPVAEEDPDNNAWDGIVEPDAPNDLEVLSADTSGQDGHLVVVIRNNSPIPVRGSFTVSVREALPSTALLGRQTVSGTVEAGATLEVPFSDLRGLSLAQISIRLSSDGVDDAVIANNTYPR